MRDVRRRDILQLDWCGAWRCEGLLVLTTRGNHRLTSLAHLANVTCIGFVCERDERARLYEGGGSSLGPLCLSRNKSARIALHPWCVLGYFERPRGAQEKRALRRVDPPPPYIISSSILFRQGPRYAAGRPALPNRTAPPVRLRTPNHAPMTA